MKRALRYAVLLLGLVATCITATAPVFADGEPIPCPPHTKHCK
jgi:hypothetical protein